jgi:hypothetical protein
VPLKKKEKISDTFWRKCTRHIAHMGNNKDILVKKTHGRKKYERSKSRW